MLRRAAPRRRAEVLLRFSPMTRPFVPLVRTDGKQYESGWMLDAAKLLDLPPLSPNAKDTLAKRTERWLKLRGGLYFYAGHACADFGDIVFVFDAALTRGRQGGASTFDTGGLAAGYVQFAGAATERVRRDWARRNSYRLGEWRRRLQRFVRAHFRRSNVWHDSAAWRRYLSGDRAHHDDVEGRLLHDRNSRRAWTFELRLDKEVDLKESAVAKHLWRIAMSRRVWDELRAALLAAPFAAGTQWRTWIREGIAVCVEDSLHEATERWIRDRVCVVEQVAV